MDGICPTKTTLKAIKDFPKPKDITGARSWFGLINTVAWTYSMQSTMQPFRNLVKPNSKFYWDEQLDKLFEESKEIIIAKDMIGIRSLTLKRKHVFKQTGPVKALVTCYSNKIAVATATSQHVAKMGGNLSSPAQDSQKMPKKGIPQLRAKLWQWHGALNTQDSLS